MRVQNPVSYSPPISSFPRSLMARISAGRSKWQQGAKIQSWPLHHPPHSAAPAAAQRAGRWEREGDKKEGNPSYVCVGCLRVLPHMPALLTPRAAGSGEGESCSW